MAYAQDSDRHWDANGTTPGNGGTGTWNTTGGNWGPDNSGQNGPYVPPWNNTLLDNAIFGGTAGTVTLGTPITVHNITFDTSAYTLTGNTLTLAGLAPTIRVNSGSSSIASALAGTAGLTKEGVGGLTLSGANTLTGDITINAGTLSLSGTSSFTGDIYVNSTARGGLTIVSDAALGVASNRIFTAAGSWLTILPTLSASRVVTLGTGGTVVEGAGAGAVRYTGVGDLTAYRSGLTNNFNDYTGQTTFSFDGFATFSSVGNLGEASALGAPVTVAKGTIIVAPGGGATRQMIYVGDGDDSNRNWDMRATGANLTFSNSGTGTLTLRGDILLSGTAGTGVGYAATTGDIDLLGQLTSTGTFASVSFSGGVGRTITLGGSNTFNASAAVDTITVKASVLANIGASSSLGAGTNVGVNNGGVLSYTGVGASSNRIWSVSGAGTISNDSVAGALNLSGALGFVAGGAVDTLTLGGSYAGGVNTFSGLISGAGGLASSGSGIWELTAANTRTGTIAVNSGTLRAGNAAAFGTVTGTTVNGGTLDLNGTSLVTPTLGGTGGTIALGTGNLTVNGTAASSYGGSITGSGSVGLIKTGTGVLTLTGQNSYTGATNVGGGTLRLDFTGAATSDILLPSSVLNLSGGSTLSLVGATEANSQSFAGVNILSGSNTIKLDEGAGGSLTLNLGALSRTAGTVNFVPEDGLITTANADGALGGWALINNTDYAKVVGGNIVAFDDNDYTGRDDAGTWQAGEIITDEDTLNTTSFFGTVASSVQLGGLRFVEADPTTTITIAGGQTLGIDGAIIVAPSVGNNSQLITGGSITGSTGGGVLAVQQSGGGNFQIASQIVDNGGATGFLKGGAGLVTLSGANNFSGATTISQGVLSVSTIGNGGAASNIGASSADASNLIIDSSELRYTGATATTDRGFTVARTLGNDPTINVTTAGSNLTFSGQVASSDSAGLTKTGAGTLTLANATNSYAGVTKIGAGTLAISTIGNGGAPSSLGASSNASANLWIEGGAALQYTGSTATTDRGLTLNGVAGGAIDVTNAGTTLTFGGVVAGLGSAPLRKEGAGTLVLSGINTYPGATNVNGGTLRAGSTKAFGGPSLVTLADTAGVTLDLAGFSNKVGGLTGGGTSGGNVLLGSATLTIGGANGTYSGTISGSGGIIKDNSSSQTFVGCNNNYTGSTTIQGSSTLTVDCLANGGFASGIGASGSASSNLVFINGGLNYTGANVSTNRGFTIQGFTGATIGVENAATTLTFSGQVTGANGLVRKEGAGTLVLSGSNVYGGGTVVAAGTLRAGSISAFGTGGMTVNAGTTLDLDGLSNSVAGITGSGNITLGSATLTLTGGGGLTFSGAISGTGGLVKSGAGTQILSGCNSSYAGSTTINGGILSVNCLANGGTNSAIGASGPAAGNLILDGGTLQYTGGATSTDRRFTLGPSSSSKIEASGTGALTMTNTNAIAFSSPGTAQTIKLGGTNTGNNSLAAQIGNNAAGTTSFTKEDSGTWILTNQTSNYTGVTSIVGGVLGVSKLSDGGSASSIGASASDASFLVIGSGTTLRYTGAGDTTNRLFTLAAGSTFLESAGTGAIAFTNTGAIGFSGTGARNFALGGSNTGANIMGASIANGAGGVTTLAKSDSGTWYLTGTNTYTGNTNINAGTLYIGNGGTTGSVVSATINNFGALGFNRSDAVTYAGTITGTGSVLQAGTGTTTLTGTNNYTGGTTISAGTLQLGNGGTTGSIVGNVANSGTLAFNRSNAVTFGGTITGTGTIAQIGTGTTTLTAANTAGATTISAGTLQVNGALETATVAMTGTSALTVNGTMGAAAGGASTFAGDAGASTININSGGTLRAAGDLGAGGDFVNVTGTLNTGAGTLSLGDGNDTLALNGNWSLGGNVAGGSGNDTLQVSSTSFRVLNGASVTDFETLNKTTAVTLMLTGDHSYINGVTNAAGLLQIGDGTATGTLVGNVANSGTLTFNRAGASTYAGVISGSGVLNQNGTGTTTLTGNSTYAGATNVNAGTLLINGNQAGATGLTSVASGATLGGAGTIGGSVTIADGGILAAGANGVGELTINGNLALANNSQLNFEFGAANVPGGPLNDLVDVGGNLTLDGVVNVTQTPGGTFGPGVYRMFNYSGALTDNGLTVGSVPVGTQAFVQTALANQVNLVNTAGLTLSFWDGAAGPKNDGTIQGGDGTWRVAGGQNNWTDPNGVVNADYAQDSFAIFQSAAGTVTVDNVGGNVLASGMQFASDGYLIDGGPLTLTGAQALIRVGVDTVDPVYTATIAAELTGSAQLVKDLAGTLVLSGTNSYTGGTAINGGTLRIASDANLGGVAGGLSLNGGTLNTTASFASARAVDLAGAGTFLTDTGTTLALSGAISGAGALTKDGAGSLILTNANSYAGGTTISAGTLQLGNGGTSGAIAGDVANDGVLAFNRSDSLTFAGAITGSGAVNQLGSGTTILTADSGYTGGTTIGAGVLQLGNGGASGGIAGDVVNNAALVFNRSNALTFAGLISGAGTLTQAGSGTTILTGANSYAGTTTVSSGTLLVNGDQSAASGATTVASGATLGGTGTIGGDVTLAGGATLAPSDATGPGTLTINGNLALAGTSRLDYEFGQANMPGGPLNDLTQVGGDLTLDGTIDVTVSPGGNFGPGLYRVISYGGTLTDNGLALGSLPPGNLVSVQTSVAGQVNLVNSTGATLNFWDGAALPNKGDGAVNGGDGIWQNSSGNDNWTELTGAVNGAYTDASFAIFAAAPGTVDVDNSLGAVSASGMQFASDGYTITGQDLTLVGPQSTIRVGDGTAPGAGFTATIGAALIGSTELVKADLGTLVLTGTNSYTGGTQIDAGTLRISSDANLGDAAGALSLNGGILNTTADIASGRAIDLLGAGTFATDAGTTLTLNGGITGAAGFTKTGTGSLVLTGTNGFGGDVDVTEGSLFVNGDQSAATGLTSIASGATLGGSGTIGGNVTLADGATLAAGTNNVGTLSIGGNLALGAGSVLDFEFGQANGIGGSLNDLVDVGGNLTLDGTINVTVPTGGTFGPGIYRAFNYGGSLTDNGLALGTLPGGSAVTVQTAIAGQVNLVNTAGLTLSFWDGNAGPKNNGTINGGDGVWRIAGGSNNWTDMTGAVNADYAQDSFAIFSAAPGIVTVDNSGGNVLASGMQFASDGYVVTGDALTLTGAQAIVQVGDGSAAGASYVATIDAELGGAAGLVKTDAGTLVLSGTNSYAGGTSINGGTIRIGADANLGAVTGGLVIDSGTLHTTANIVSGRAVDLVGAGTFLTDSGTSLTLGGAISGAGSLGKSGGGTLVLTANNNYAGGTLIDAGLLQLGNGGTSGSIAGDVVNNAALAFNRSDIVTFGGLVSGSGAVTQAGTGTTILTANNSYAGGTTIAAGTLQLGDGGTTGSITGDVTNNGTLAFGRSDSITFAGLISGSGGVDQIGSGTTILTGGNSYAGATNVTAGSLLVNGNQSAATGLTSVASGASLGGTGTIGGDVIVAGGGTLAPGAGGAGALTINGNLSLAAGSALGHDFGLANAPGSPLNDVVNVGGDLSLDGTINVAVTPGGSFDIGLYRVINYGGALTDNGLAIGTTPAGSDVFVQTSVANQVNLINTGGATLNFWDGAAGPKFDGAVNGGDGIWQNGTGNDNWADATGAVNAPFDDGAFAIFTGAAGTVTIDNSLGTVTASGLQFATDGYTITGQDLTLVGPQSMIRVGDGTAASSGYVATIASAITGGTQLVKTDAGTLLLSGSNSYTGGTAINGGTVRISSDANLGSAAGAISFDGGTLNTTSSLSSARAVDLAGAGTFLTDAGTVLTLGGAVSGAGGLTKSGAGTLVLGGSGTFGGATVAGGTMLVNGSYAAVTGTTNVLAGATMGGTGTIGGNVAYANGATLAPGAGAAGTLTIGGNLSLSATTQLDFEFGEVGAVGGALNDLVNVGGNLVLDGVLNVGVPAGGAFDVGVYRMFNYGGALTDNGVTLGTLPGGADAQVQTSVAGQVNLVNSAGLTLNFWDGAAGPKNNGVINGGNGVWQNSGGNDNWADVSGAVNAPYSDGAFAVFGGTGGTVTVDNGLGAVSAAGMQFAANNYVIAGGGITLTDPTATIRVGDGSVAGAGFTATINSALNGTAQLVKTDAGTLVLGGANAYTGGTLITGGAVRIASDANLGAADGAVTLDGGALETSANMASARGIFVASEGTISAAADTVFTYDGLFSGTGSLTKAGAGTLLVTADNSGFAGSTSVAAGTLAVQGSLGGSVDVAAAGRLEGTGRVGSIVNSGIVAPGRGEIGTLTVAGDYGSNGGTLEIEAELGGDGSLSDRLVVNGATSGSTRVTVTNRGGLGAQTVEGIKIVDVAGASNGSFALEGDYIFGGEQAIIAGAFGYRLYKNGVATPTDGDWYLRSALLNGSNEPQGPLYQPGVPLYENYGQVLASLNTLPTLQERVGNRQWAQSADGASNGIWGRMESTRARPEARVSTAGTDANIDSWKMQIGVDRTLSDGDSGVLVAGLTGHYGESNASVRSMFGDGTIKAKAYGAGATLTWYSEGGFYADAQAQFAWFDGRLTSSVLGTLVDGNDGTGKAFSLELGKRAMVGSGLTVTPQVQMIYQDADFDSFADPSEAMVSSAKGDSLKTRWGISLDHQKAWEANGTTRRSHLYGLVNVSYEWLDGTEANVSGTAIRNSNDRLRGEIALGGSLGLNDRVTIYTQASASSPFRDFGDDYSIKGVAGVRVAF
ncbi:autotransporter-associated beta strand repeat-containing protein [Sphingopyxis sp.]|uniref:autotransporter-associated beta strand repeat-containing protein n=1 Tax=Sphingopyxis sp. TaxID=1908224 RepID=UPI002D786F05|nr:autotransporter-associated beta strand repeat-containing protein [Sphingopyxis sp.]HET6523561.1 autotransporter-associated beta strand repeat-containing protein [Sphingopyxis sp.]